MHKKKLPALLLLLCLLSSLWAQESFDALDGFEDFDALDGFSQMQIAEPVENQDEPMEPTALILSGKLAFKSSYGYKEHSVDGVDYSGINQAQSSLYLQLDSKLHEEWSLRISGNGFYDAFYALSAQNFNDEVLNSYESQLFIDDMYLQGRVSKDIDLKIGRQIVVWGKSDSIRITDVINPLDNRLPGLTDIKDLRLSTAMLKIDYYLGSWNLSAMLIPESRIFLEPAVRGEFFPVDAVFPSAPDPFIALEQPKSGFEDLDAMQYAFAANGLFSGWDLSLYAADVLDSRWHIRARVPNASREVSKIRMLGSALNIVSGSWLFKSEMAFMEGLRYNSSQEKKSRFDALVGFDYMGIKDSVLSLEIANRHIFDYESQMGIKTDGALPDFVQRDEVQTALRATRSFRNDTLNATLFVSMFGHSWEYGGITRASLAYNVQDGVVANIGIIEYIKPENHEKRPLMEAIHNNARFFADISLSF